MIRATPANHENPPSPPFSKGGMGEFESYFIHNLFLGVLFGEIPVVSHVLLFFIKVSPALPRPSYHLWAFSQEAGNRVTESGAAITKNCTIASGGTVRKWTSSPIFCLARGEKRTHNEPAAFEIIQKNNLLINFLAFHRPLFSSAITSSIAA